MVRTTLAIAGLAILAIPSAIGEHTPIPPSAHLEQSASVDSTTNAEYRSVIQRADDAASDCLREGETIDACNAVFLRVIHAENERELENQERAQSWLQSNATLDPMSPICISVGAGGVEPAIC